MKLTNFFQITWPLYKSWELKVFVSMHHSLHPATGLFDLVHTRAYDPCQVQNLNRGGHGTLWPSPHSLYLWPLSSTKLESGWTRQIFPRFVFMSIYLQSCETDAEGIVKGSLFSTHCLVFSEDPFVLRPTISFHVFEFGNDDFEVHRICWISFPDRWIGNDDVGKYLGMS